MMDVDTINAGAPPMRTATVVAEGHLVLLGMTTAEARACFGSENLDDLRRLAAARQDMLTNQAAVRPMLPMHATWTVLCRSIPECSALRASAAVCLRAWTVRY